MPPPPHCPRCGASTRPQGEHSVLCGGCGKEHWGHSRPTAGVFLTREGKVLLTLRAFEPAKGKWDIPGGFLHEGEPPEVGARREIEEELGWRLGPLSLVVADINPLPDGPVLDCIYEAAAPRSDPRPADDVADFAWFAPDALPDDADLAFPGTRRLLDRYRAHIGHLSGHLLLDGSVALPGQSTVVATHGPEWRDLPEGAAVEAGSWSIHDGVLCGRIEGDKPAVLWLAPAIAGDHMLAFRAHTVPPCRNDINCYWEGSGRILGPGDITCTIAGVGGWFHGLTGIERHPEGGRRATARLFAIEPSRGYEIVAGRRGGSDFLFVDGRLAMQLDDPQAQRRSESRVALATWDGHVHFERVSLHRLDG